jgi:hypothetical protein
MKRSYSLFATVLFIIAAALYFLYPTDENRIRKTIKGGASAVMAEDIDGVMEYVSYNYNDRYGNNYLLLKKRLQNIFRRLDDIDIERNIVKISVKEKLAEVELSVRVLATPSSGPSPDGFERAYLIGDAGEAADLKITLEKSSYKWLITEVDGLYGKGVVY